MSLMPAWSFSSLNDFLNCPRSYQLTRVTKECKKEGSAAMTHGNTVHKHLEDRMKSYTPLPQELDWMEPHISTMERSGGVIEAEQNIGLTEDLVPCGYWDKNVWVRGKLDLSIRYSRPNNSVVLDYKGLALDTKIPTPSGWATMGELRVGDTVFGGDGSRCLVTAKSEIHHRKCYELLFDDGERIVCDDEHLWVTNGDVRSTKSIAETLLYGGQKHHKIELHCGLSLPDVDLPVHPYVLGAWLGDGKHTSGEICKPDQELWDNIAACGYTLSHNYSAKAGNGKAAVRTVKGLRRELRTAKVLGDKHIPAVYLRASHSQRLQLLQGLMDTDGSGNSFRKQAVFTTCDKRLSDSVVELLLTLGQRPGQSETVQHGFGLTVTAWPVHFRPIWGLTPFRLPRKQAKIEGAGPGHSWRRLIIDAREVDTVPTQCISVDSCDATYLCGDRMTVTHNTGKRKVDGDQLMLFAGFEFAVTPDVKEVRTGYVWLPAKVIDTEIFTQKDKPRIWGHFLPKVERMAQAYEKDVWPCKPSGLCPWCPAKKAQCVHSDK